MLELEHTSASNARERGSESTRVSTRFCTCGDIGGCEGLVSEPIGGADKFVCGKECRDAKQVEEVGDAISMDNVGFDGGTGDIDKAGVPPTIPTERVDLKGKCC